MKSSFPGFPKDAVRFFRQLEDNNNREWFQAHKDVFDQQVQAPMHALLDELNTQLTQFAPAYVTEARKALYRIYRDTRFSADKTPYKLHIAASLWRQGLEKNRTAGFYFSVNHKEVEVGGGGYLIDPESLPLLRQHIAANAPLFRRMTEAKKVRDLLGEVQGDKLSRVPKGFPADHPAADLIRGKQWYFYTLLDPALVTTPKLVPELMVRFRAMAPFVEFLNAPLVTQAAAKNKAEAFLRDF
jgi:uncharacterized protein (TIGR02453 family)